MEVSIFVAFSAGLLSFFSPCILPLIPVYIGYISGSSMKEIEYKNKGMVFTRAVGFVIGFTIIFMVMGAAASYIGQLFFQYRILFLRVGGLIITIFGLHITGLVKIPLLYKEYRALKPDKIVNWFSSVLIGMAFAAGWSYCVGPILSTILIYVAATETVLSGITLLFLYSLGLGIPFLIAALGIKEIAAILNRIKGIIPYVTLISGILMMLFGILMFFNRIQWLNNLFGLI